MKALFTRKGTSRHNNPAKMSTFGGSCVQIDSLRTPEAIANMRDGHGRYPSVPVVMIR